MNLRATPVDPPEAVVSSRVIRVPHSPAGVGIGRRRVRAALEAAGVAQPLLDDIEMVASELLGNAVRHARALAGEALLVGWRIEDVRVTVQVTDGGSRHHVQPTDGPALSESGRGLRIIDRLAEVWGVQDQSEVRTVWASFPGLGDRPSDR